MGNGVQTPKGWFSRRHQTADAHRAAREQYETRRERRPRQTWYHPEYGVPVTPGAPHVDGAVSIGEIARGF